MRFEKYKGLKNIYKKRDSNESLFFMFSLAIKMIEYFVAIKQNQNLFYLKM